MNNRCPKCNQKLSPFYMKQTCPKCGVNLMYYKLDERLEEDAKQAEKEVRDVWLLLRKIDKAKIIEKICKKQNKPLPWEDSDVKSDE